MLTACISQLRTACYTQIATCTIVERCGDVSTGSTGESEQKTVGVTQTMHYLDCGKSWPEMPRCLSKTLDKMKTSFRILTPFRNACRIFFIVLSSLTFQLKKEVFSTETFENDLKRYVSIFISMVKDCQRILVTEVWRFLLPPKLACTFI